MYGPKKNSPNPLSVYVQNISHSIAFHSTKLKSKRINNFLSKITVLYRNLD